MSTINKIEVSENLIKLLKMQKEKLVMTTSVRKDDIKQKLEFQNKIKKLKHYTYGELIALYNINKK